jgi:hypothetical protein
MREIFKYSAEEFEQDIPLGRYKFAYECDIKRYNKAIRLQEPEQTNLGCDGLVEGSCVDGSEPVEISLCLSVAEKA